MLLYTELFLIKFLNFLGYLEMQYLISCDLAELVINSTNGFLYL